MKRRKLKTCHLSAYMRFYMEESHVTHLGVAPRDGASRVVVADDGDDIEDMGTRGRGRRVARDSHGHDGGPFLWT